MGVFWGFLGFYGSLFLVLSFPGLKWLKLTPPFKRCMFWGGSKGFCTRTFSGGVDSKRTPTNPRLLKFFCL